MDTDTALLLLKVVGVVYAVLLLIWALNRAQRRAGRRFPRSGANIESYQSYVDRWNKDHPNDEITGWKP